jgi:arylsulfatase A-like enzyme
MEYSQNSRSRLNRRQILKYGLYGTAMSLSPSLWLSGCRKRYPSSDKPNILWIVWDTVRADHMSLYAYEKQTTPFLDDWARQGRVFSNCTSVSNSTVPTHVSMFTGLMPSEHRRDNTQNYLGDAFIALPELLHEHGYQTYMYSANPHISRRRNFAQGFDITEHPWGKKYKYQALKIFQNKLNLRDRSTEHLTAINHSRILGKKWSIPAQAFTASGELAQQGTENWLKTCSRKRPFLVFLKYMEAHQPYIPPDLYRKRLMTPQQVDKSYEVYRSQLAKWGYTFGLKEYTEEEIEITKLTYDATLADLDNQLRKLLASLKVRGYMDNTMVIITSDHGEHLGEQHMLDHLFSVYECLIRVPLIIYYPKLFSPGTDERPVMNFDLFSTVLELAGIEMPKVRTKAVSLLRPQDSRIRVAERPARKVYQYRIVQKEYPDFDPTPWNRQLRAVYQGKYKFIWTSDGRYELYDLKADPGEMRNLTSTQPELGKKLESIHDNYVTTLRKCGAGTQENVPMTDEQRRRLESLGYIGPSQE